MIQIGSQVRVVRPGLLELRGEVVATSPGGFVGGVRRRDMVKVRPDQDQVTVVAYPGQLDRWVEATECIEEPVVSAPPDALFPRPTLADAAALRILSDQLEEQGNDPGAALLRDVAGRIERFDESWRQTAEFLHAHNELARSILGDIKAIPPAGDVPGWDPFSAP
jgi:hypothetical protein